MEHHLRKKPGVIVASLVIANFLAQLMQTMLNTALPRMMSDLEIQENEGQWLITIYFLITGIVVPVAGFLIGKFSTRALFFASGGAFITGTLIAAVSSDFAMVLAGRLVQGMGAGLLMPLFQTTILRVFPKEKMGTAMGLVGLVMGLAPALGPTLSGFVVEHQSWRLLFYGVLPVALANLLLAYISLRNVGEKNTAKLDLRSVLYSSLGFAGLLYGLSLAGDQGKSAVLAGVVIFAGAGMIVLLIRRQLKLAEPLLDFNLFRSRMFTYSSVIGVILFFVVIGLELFLPLYAQKVRGLTPRESGLMLLPGALLMGGSGLISGRLYDRFGVRMLTRVSFLSMTATLLVLAILLTLHTPFLLLILIFALFMTEVGFIMAPITAFTMSSVPASRLAHASPMTITIRSLGGSTSGAVLVAVMTSVSGYSGLDFPGNMLQGIRVVFWILAAMAGLGLVLTFYLKEHAKLDVARR
ncbi:DHA2 family efflux MFS transporter permease subunit [Paenibacillus sp. sgz500958]|uniref:DHA2 family efflux MFS transporter permease subunit n=1 Tax=Paenibacillus sp. sgz500958 TaxID=3242475 RepID=UPI0036D36040